MTQTQPPPRPLPSGLAPTPERQARTDLYKALTKLVETLELAARKWLRDGS